MLPLYLTLKYLKFKHKDKNISLMIKVCFAGILIGTFALMLTLIITNGFEKTIHEKIQGINSQITINSPGNKLNTSSIKSMLNKEFREVEAVSGSSLKQIIIEKDNNQTLIVLKGISPQDEAKVTNLGTKITYPLQPLNILIQNNGVIIGHKLAKEWGLSVGDSIKILVPESDSRNKIYLSKEKIKVTGIFNVGLDEYDSGFGFCSIDFLNDIFDEEGVDQISIKLKTPHGFFSRWSNNEKTVITSLKNRLPQFNVYSWKELYPALVSSLKLEKYVMFIIIALITLVASLNMVSLLFIQIQQKKRDIAILKAMGMLQKDIHSIFLTMGLGITFLGSALGLLFAGMVGFALEKYPLIELPDVYYVTHLPARLEPELFLIVFLSTMLLGLVATWIPAKRASNTSITNVLRME